MTSSRPVVTWHPIDIDGSAGTPAYRGRVDGTALFTLYASPTGAWLLLTSFDPEPHVASSRDLGLLLADELLEALVITFGKDKILKGRI